MTKTFDFFYDLGSPYSYLASTQLGGIEQRTGAKARLLPITLGGLRKATGHHIPPPQQLKYMSEDT
ncbi:MAG: 2-hydroxychromene-2-carboxylate isomerase, partial [Deltaproteobacteria bacterium]